MKKNTIKSYIQRLIKTICPDVSFLVMDVKVVDDYYNTSYIILVSLGKKTKKQIEKSYFEYNRNMRYYRYNSNGNVKSKDEILKDTSNKIAMWTQSNVLITDSINLFNKFAKKSIY